MTCDGFPEAVAGLSTALGKLLEEFREEITHLHAGETRTLASVKVGGVTFSLSAFSCDTLDGLTEREREVAKLVAQSLGDKEIADRLGISVRTASSHVRRIFLKSGVHCRMDLARLVNLLNYPGLTDSG